MTTLLLVLALSIAASFFVLFAAFALYLYSFPARLRVHAPLCDSRKV